VTGQEPEAVVGGPRWVLARYPTNGFDTWELEEPPIVRVEQEAPAAWEKALSARGYEVRCAAAGDQSFGHAQLIALEPSGVLAGAALCGYRRAQPFRVPTVGSGHQRHGTGCGDGGGEAGMQATGAPGQTFDGAGAVVDLGFHSSFGVT